MQIDLSQENAVSLEKIPSLRSNPENISDINSNRQKAMVCLASLKVSSHNFVCQTRAEIKYKYRNVEINNS